MNMPFVTLHLHLLKEMQFYILTIGIDDYAKDGGTEVVRLLCSFCHEPLRSLVVKEL